MTDIIKNKEYLKKVYANIRPICSLCDNLKERWKYEREYEDFNDYIIEVRYRFEKIGFKLVKMTKTFQLELITPDKVTIYAKIKSNSDSLSYVKK